MILHCITFVAGLVSVKIFIEKHKNSNETVSKITFISINKKVIHCTNNTFSRMLAVITQSLFIIKLSM